VTAHDGFTLADLVSYNEKHNEVNGEENHDGQNEDLSWNCGVEGPSTDPALLALRARQQRNFLATLLLSQGAPMLLMGDELGRTQQGNNNAYCQDNELSWMDWKLDRPGCELLEFTRLLIHWFHQHPVLRRRKFFQGRKIRGSEVKALAWFRPDGKERADEDWNNADVHCLGLRLAGDAIEEVDVRGNRIVDDTLLILLNAYHEPLSFILPAHRAKVRWEEMLETREAIGTRRSQLLRGGEAYELEGRSLALLRLRQESGLVSSRGDKFLFHEDRDNVDEKSSHRTVARFYDPSSPSLRVKR
jgi:glycogen operon protein